MSRIFCLISALVVCGQSPTAYGVERVFPGIEWEIKPPAELNVNEEQLQALADDLDGRGFISRKGYQIFTWGDYRERGDIASAAKPFYAHFLFKAYETGRIPSLDEPVAVWEPHLETINADLYRKDRAITWRHLANQTSSYGLAALPGTAFAYNDWQMALFWDILFKEVYETDFTSVDEDVFRPLLTDEIGFQDAPTMMAFGTDDRPGRVSLSPRDHARFGLLYMHEGSWKGTPLLRQDLVKRAVCEPVPNTIPRAGFEETEMIEGQRSIGSTRVPDNQTPHRGSYSWLWWINGVDAEGRRHWPDAPEGVYAALGHDGRRGMAVMPSLEIVMAWNDIRLDHMESAPHPLNNVFRRLVASVEE